ncbi:DUF4153 domain-containing protein [Massilia sp. IC2-476]|uniref:DUF4153 domain-containing protein n=1 Tax=Massilia sp. IC2-476 TaxID=2887199 RepID=UPI001D10B3D7|nr:DUF4153 domain-containing protein [Massilia sp. IC2-476]MCC2971597.1 DUF4153 domain-containing protein [Massilia sp. IC2-476]
MHAAAFETPDLAPRPGLAATRIAIGLVQGVVLYFLYRAGMELHWPATVPRLFVPLLLLCVLAPVIAISGLGQLTRSQLLLWTAAAAAIIVLLAFHDVWRMEGAWRPPAPPKPRAPEPSSQLNLALVGGLFIAHAMVLAGALERRRIASYGAYFETAWKLGVQLAFSGLFVGVTWLVLHLGAQLFLLIKLDFLSKAIRESWFSIPVTTFAFATALHLTDVRPGIVRGIRNLLLVLLSWILPVLTLLVAGFLASLPFTGLEPLWATRSAAASLLGAAAAFVVLINAAWQNGAVQVARPITLAARVASLLLVPVTLLAIYALALRVQDHGWTEDRVVAAACLLVAACYAGGYAAAALRKGWLPTLAGVNIAAAFMVLAVLLALYTPLLDPARLSTEDQLARLASGRVSAARFDVGYLHFDGARYGAEALARLDAQGGAALRERIAAVRKLQNRYYQGLLADAPDLATNLRVWPAGTRLPDSFRAINWVDLAVGPNLPDCLRLRGRTCDALVRDVIGDARPEVLLFGDDAWNSVIASEEEGGRWRIAGRIRAVCPAYRQALREGKLSAVQPLRPELEVAGRRIRVDWTAEDAPCPPEATPQPDAPPK